MTKHSRKPTQAKKGSSKVADIPKKVKQPIPVKTQKFSRVKPAPVSQRGAAGDSGTFGSQADMNAIHKSQLKGLGKINK